MRRSGFASSCQWLICPQYRQHVRSDLSLRVVAAYVGQGIDARQVDLLCENRLAASIIDVPLDHHRQYQND